MRDYGRVHCTFWSSPTTAGLTDKGKLLALYLMSCTHGTIAGVFRLPDGYIAEDLQWGTADVRQAFGELLEKGFANRCETTKWVWLVKHMEWNPPENPNQRKAAVKVASGVPSNCFWRLAFMRACGKSLGLNVEPDVPPTPSTENPLATVPETVVQPVAVAVVVAEAAVVAEAEAGSAAEAPDSTGRPKSANNSVYSPEFEQVWKEYPMRPGHSKAEAYKCWNARIAGGENVQTMADGVRRYAAYCEAMRTEPRFVKHAATFFGPDRHYLNDWTPAVGMAAAAPLRGAWAAMTDQQRAAANAASTAEAAKLLGFTSDAQEEVVNAAE